MWPNKSLSNLSSILILSGLDMGPVREKEDNYILHTAPFWRLQLSPDGFTSEGEGFIYRSLTTRL